MWVIEHEGERILVDTGETHEARDIPFSKMSVGVEDELPAKLATLGLGVDDIDTVVLTHMHGDHMDGAVHLGGRPVLVNPVELDHQKNLRSASSRRCSPAVPAG